MFPVCRIFYNLKKKIIQRLCFFFPPANIDYYGWCFMTSFKELGLCALVFMLDLSYCVLDLKFISITAFCCCFPFTKVIRYCQSLFLCFSNCVSRQIWAVGQNSQKRENLSLLVRIKKIIKVCDATTSQIQKSFWTLKQF